MSENSEKCQSQIPRVQDGTFKCVVLSDQESETQKYSVHSAERKAANDCVREAESTEFWD